MAVPEVSLRQATAADTEFAYLTTRETMREYTLATWGACGATTDAGVAIDADHERGALVAIDELGRDDADHARRPALALLFR